MVTHQWGAPTGDHPVTGAQAGPPSPGPLQPRGGVPRLGPHCVGDAWPVMVVLQNLGFLAQGKKFEMPVVRLPVVCVGSVSAGCVWNALWGQDHFKVKH